MTGFRSILCYKTANYPKIRILAKVWKFQLNIPCGFFLSENVISVKPVIWSVCQVLN
jgi:hypothetical protein